MNYFVGCKRYTSAATANVKTYKSDTKNLLNEVANGY